MIVVGIDPGKSGGVAVISEDTVNLRNTPEETTGMADIIRSAQSISYIDGEELTAYIENVHAFPTDGRSSAFKFGMNYGMWLGILGAYKVNVIKVTPRVWMNDYAPLSKIKKERKKELKIIGQEMFPDTKVTLKTSDALLIAVWGMNQKKGDKTNATPDNKGNKCNR
jgi:hypothetical protein|tara:strand:- start:1746 stop:2246 length:501 start_codon:yes stop_codon:yes gene_type:complete